jgi:uridine kinase
LLAVSGFGGSGKSTLARELAKKLDAPVLGIDEFGTAGVWGRSSDWSGLDRSRLVRQVLAPLKAGEPSVSYDSCYDWENWRSLAVKLTVNGALVIEGIGIFHPELQAYLDFRIWLDVDLETATRRGIERDRAAGQTTTQAWTDIWAPTIWLHATNAAITDTRTMATSTAATAGRPDHKFFIRSSGSAQCRLLVDGGGTFGKEAVTLVALITVCRCLMYEVGCSRLCHNSPCVVLHRGRLRIPGIGGAQSRQLHHPHL